jgi:heme/copper-type cytochrome/quinol oxidase subunit 2
MSINLELFKNPVIIGLVAGALTYAYMYWENEQKYKKKPASRKKPVSFIPPAVVAVIVWFIASSYFDSSQNTGTTDQTVPDQIIKAQSIQIQKIPNSNMVVQNTTASIAPNTVIATTPNTIISTKGKFANSNFPRPNLQFGGKSLDDLSVDSFGSKSYHLISKGNISLPTTRNLSLPSTFIEMDTTI